MLVVTLFLFCLCRLILGESQANTLVQNLTNQYNFSHNAIPGGLVMFWDFQPQNRSNLRIAIAANAYNWASVGFNTEPLGMESSIVAVCSENRIRQAFLSQKDPNITTNNTLTPNDFVPGASKFYQVDGYIFCQLEWKTNTNRSAYNFTFNPRSSNMVWAYGYKDTPSGGNRSSATLNLMNPNRSTQFFPCDNETCENGHCSVLSCVCDLGWNGTNCTIREIKKIDLVHGVCMYIVWLFLFPLGMIFALCKKVVRETLKSTDGRPRGQNSPLESLFFWLHLSTQSTGICLILVALYFSLIHNRWDPERFVTNHRLYGYFVIALISCQVISIFFGPLRHQIWYHFHRWVGLGSVLFAWCNILPGMVEIGAYSYLYVHAIIIVCWFLVYCAVNYYLQRWQESVLTNNAEAFGLEVKFTEKWYNTFPEDKKETK